MPNNEFKFIAQIEIFQTTTLQLTQSQCQTQLEIETVLKGKKLGTIIAYE